MAAPDGGLATRSGLARIPLGRLLEWVISLACVVFLVLWFRGKPLPDMLATPATFAWALAAVAFFFASIGVGAERWHYLLRRQVPASTRGTAYRSLGLAEVTNALLPMRAGDAVRVGIVSEREKRPLVGSAGVLVVERGVGLTTQLVLLAATGAVALSQVPAALRSPLLAAAAVLLVAAAAAAIAWGMVAFNRAVVRFAPWRAVASLSEPFARLTAPSAVACAGLSAGVFCAEGLAWWSAAHAAGIGLPLVDALFLQTLATLVTIVPAGPGAIGTLDAAIVLALGYVGWSGGDGLGFVLMLRVAIVLGCVGFWLSVTGGDLLRRSSGRLAAWRTWR